jgi:hypothetical protein
VAIRPEFSPTRRCTLTRPEMVWVVVKNRRKTTVRELKVVKPRHGVGYDGVARHLQGRQAVGGDKQKDAW